MKKIFLIVMTGAGLLLTFPVQAQVLLQLINPGTGASDEMLSPLPGSNFTLDIDVQDLTSTQALTGFDLTLASLPNGITLSSFTQVLPNFIPNVNSPASLFYSADNSDPSQDVIIDSTQTSILQANFTLTSVLAPGAYHIDFITHGIFQGLYDDDGNDISYVDERATLTVASTPEPQTIPLLILGVAIHGVHFFRFSRNNKYYNNTRVISTLCGAKWELL